MIERPSNRYGRPRWSQRHRGRIALGAMLVVVIAGIAIAIVASRRLGAAEVAGALSGYRLVDDSTVEVIISVTRDDPSRPAVCIVRARSVDGSETGRREVLIAASTQSTVQVTTVVKAARPAVGDVYGCGPDVPPYLVAP